RLGRDDRRPARGGGARRGGPDLGRGADVPAGGRQRGAGRRPRRPHPRPRRSRAVIEGVLPTALTVSDLERSLRFYRDLLGFTVAAELPPDAERERWDAYHNRVVGMAGAQIRVVYLRAPDGQTHLELIEYLRPKEEPRPPASF